MGNQLIIKIPDFIMPIPRIINELEILLDNLNKFGIADSYKKIVNNLYQIQALESVFPWSPKIIFPRVKGLQMKDKYAQYASEIITNLRIIENTILPDKPDKYYILPLGDPYGFEYQRYY